ncbi:sensor histidine kinase [Dysosmobacter sp.]|uniref:sensor histidine kinase n=1 Tax=Dysosmobacter sp. TaxID=2591382 RepID=UPI002A8C8FC7|nr:sensor histidine kinase [Dysosmobacter sp.]MDY3281221.1 sensor histidine kinase [Dysosmobacter sp.]
MEQDELGSAEQLLARTAAQLRSAMEGIPAAAAALAPPEDRDGDPALDARAALLDQGCYRLGRLAANLTMAARLQGGSPLYPADRDIVALTEQVCRRCVSLGALLELNVTFRCTLPAHVCAVDRDSYEHLLLQLLSNAFKFTPAGGSVTVELRRASGRVLLSVWDTGSGIPAELLPTLFTHCLRQEGPSALPPHGLGLGLLLCRRIAQAHGGSMVAETRPGEGSTVTLSLPDRQVGRPPEADLPADGAGGFNPTLLGLADALPPAAFLLREEE